MDNKTLKVFIGRCSPPHLGHIAVLRQALRTSDAVLILIGSSGKARDTKNPFSFEERKEMLERALLGINHNAILEIQPLRDYVYNNQRWIQQVQMRVEAFKNLVYKVGGWSTNKQYLTGSNRDDTTWYLHSFGSYFDLDLIEPKNLEVEMSATHVREILFQQADGMLALEELIPVLPASTYRFLSEFVKTPEYDGLVQEYKNNTDKRRVLADIMPDGTVKVLPHPPIYSTVDTCVIQSGHVLVNVRDNFPGKGLWALPGGYLEKSEWILDGAIRELQEETRIALSPAQLYGSIKAEKIFDYPGRSLRGRVITKCYLLKLDDSKPLPKVKPQPGEVKEVMWVPIAEALERTDKWFEDHWDIVEWGVSQI